MFFDTSRRASRLAGTAAVVAWFSLATTAVAQDVDYNKAERFLTWNTSLLVSGDQVRPNWMQVYRCTSRETTARAMSS